MGKNGYLIVSSLKSEAALALQLYVVCLVFSISISNSKVTSRSDPDSKAFFYNFQNFNFYKKLKKKRSPKSKVGSCS